MTPTGCFKDDQNAKSWQRDAKYVHSGVSDLLLVFEIFRSGGTEKRECLVTRKNELNILCQRSDVQTHWVPNKKSEFGKFFHDREIFVTKKSKQSEFENFRKELSGFVVVQSWNKVKVLEM